MVFGFQLRFLTEHPCKVYAELLTNVNRTVTPLRALQRTDTIVGARGVERVCPTPRLYLTPALELRDQHVARLVAHLPGPKTAVFCS